MSAVIRGRTTAPTALPNHWRGPLPDSSIQRRLPATTDEVSDDGTRKPQGYTPVPLSLLHGGFQDLAVLVWVQLRLWFQDGEGRTNYYELAKALGVDTAAPSAIKAKFSAALQPLLGTWILRRRMTENEFAYKAVVHKPHKRYAMIRRWDLALLPETKNTRMPVRPADIADFGRWQLECGPRGWTAESTKVIAESWHVTPPTIRASRKRLALLGLLKIVVRENRLSELTWLEELYDPHWMVPSQTAIEPKSSAEVEKKDLTLGTPQGEATSEKSLDLASKDRLTLVRKKTWPPIEEDLTDSLSDDLSNLGGTSVPPLTYPTREPVDAPPPASRSEKQVAAERFADYQQTAALLIRQRPVMAAAKPHFRKAMVKRLAAALEQGLAPGHADRALSLVAEEGAFDAECLLLQRALQQAWTDQRVGMCADCGDRDRHSPGCSQFDFSWDDGTTTGGRRDDASRLQEFQSGGRVRSHRTAAAATCRRRSRPAQR